MKAKTTPSLPWERVPSLTSGRDSMAEWLEEELRKLPDVEVRPMFGGAGIYAEGMMFGILHKGRVYLKTNDSTRAAFVERGMGAFRPSRGSVLKNYLEIPADVLDDSDAFLTWARQALAVANQTESKSRGRGAAPGVTPEQILEGLSPALRRLADRARKLVLKEAPDAVEAGYPGWRLIGYRCPHYFCFVAPQADHVRLGFEHGRRLPDPDSVLEPMGKQVKFVRLVPGKAIPLRSVRALVRAALATRPLGRKAQ